MSRATYNIKAIITLFPTEAGGRHNAIQSGYRPDFGFNTEKQYSGKIELLGREELQPGQTAKVYVLLLPARTISKNLKPSDAFSIREGNKIVGTGVIEEVNEAFA